MTSGAVTEGAPADAGSGREMAVSVQPEPASVNWKSRERPLLA